MTVLIVDDAVLTRAILRQILEKLGHRVIAADSVSSAIALFCKEHPEFVFLDLNLAGESGMQIFAELGALHLDVPFVVLTASSDERQFLSAKAAGIREIAHKPFNIDSIRKLISNHKPENAERRLQKVSLTLESRILDKARALAAQHPDKTLENVLEEFLHQMFDTPVSASEPK